MGNNKFKIYTLGCKVNQYDSLNLRKKLEADDFRFVREGADWVIVNTCAVTKTAIRKDRQMVSKAKNENPQAKIILSGCFPKVYKSEAEKLGVNYIFGVGEGEKIIKLINSKQVTNSKLANNFVILNEAERGEESLCEPGMTRKKDPSLSPEITRDVRSRYFLKIQDGCEQFCTYCIIPYTRGKLTSRPLEEIIQEAQAVVGAGSREIVLTGIHLGMYGKEVKSRKLKVESDLVVLIKKLLKIKDLKRIRLSSIEINEVSDKLINLISKNKKICNHLHIPLQSGSDNILKLMNRPYNTKYFENKINEIKKHIPEIAISADVIVGFPGEGEREFQETYDFIKRNKFSKLHVFPFSAHEKTPAFKFPDQIKENIKIARAKKLRDLGDELEIDFRNKFIGREVEVLVENIRDGIARGKTGEYLDIEFEDKGFEVGEIIKVKLGKS